MKLENSGIRVSTLRELEERYQAFSRRGLGGRRALSGFEYQFALSIDQFFERVLAVGPAGADIAFDSLSDLAERNGEILFFSQVKRSLTRAKLRDAWMEFLDLDRFLESEHPDLRTRSRYRVVCAIGAAKLKDYEAAGELGLAGDDEARWNYVRDRYLGWEERVDPRASLVARLWGQVQAPFNFVDACYGLLLQRLGDNASSQDIAETLLRNYEVQQSRTLLAGRPLSPQDFRPKSAGERRILTGERPTISDLNAGCFMDRTVLLDLVLQRLEAAQLTESTFQNVRKVPVVWIGGGSGAGKSALLLQVLRAWVERYDVPAIYLSHFASEIPEAMRRLGSNGGIVAVDDLYAPGVRSSDLWSEVSRLAAQVTSMTVLACGAPDYYEAFSDLCSREGTLEPIKVEVPPLDDDEAAGYLEWYTGRRGGKATNLPSRNFVVAAFVLERRRRGDTSLEEFAARLKQRLEEMEFITDFRAALAVNRLGLQLPGWFFDGHQDDLRRLKDEALVISTSVTEDRTEVWFHPKVASALYDLWRPPATSGEARRMDIVACFRAVREDSDAASAVLQLLVKKGTRLDEALRKDVVSAIWGDLISDEPPFLKFRLIKECRAIGMELGSDLVRRVPRAKIQSWLHAPALEPAAWARVLQLFWDAFDEQFRTSVRSELGDWLRRHGELAEWTFVWLLLWRDPRRRTVELSDLAMSWLSEHTQSRGWSFVFQPLVDSGLKGAPLLDIGRKWLKHGVPTPVDIAIWAKVKSLGLNAEEAVHLLVVRGSKHGQPYVIGRILAQLQQEALAFPIAVLEGLEAAQDGHGWPYLFEGLCKEDKWPSKPNRERLIACGGTWLTGREDEPAWPFVWQYLLRFDRKNVDIREIGHAWLIGHENHPAWLRVWLPLLKLDPRNVELRDTGRAWFSGREDTPGWSRAWRFLLKLDPQNMELREAGHAWLTGREDRPDWNYVWQRLLQLSPNERRLHDIGRTWLTGRGDKPDWAFVWQHLLRIKPADTELRTIGLNWLTAREHRPEWNYVWKLLLELDPNDSTLRNIGHSFLDGREHEPAWVFVWQVLLDLEPDDAELRKSGHIWLRSHPDNPGWSYAWVRLVELQSQDLELYDIGRRWLAGREDRPAWPFVWQQLLDLHPTDTGLTDVGRAWLTGREDSPGWSFVWQRLHQLAPEDEELRQTGLTWLSGRDEKAGWNVVWQHLLERDPKDQVLRKLGRVWHTSPVDRPTAASSWQRLLDVDPENLDLRNTVRAWLTGREDKPEWPFAWQRLLELGPDDVVLRDIGHGWISGHEDSPAWSYVWQRLLDLDPDDAELCESGRAWVSGRNDNPSWSYVWSRLLERDPKDTSLEEAGRAWLTGREDTAAWTYVWQRLIALVPEDISLRDAGRAWLAGREDRNEWTYVWERLLELDSKDMRLRELGHLWLIGREHRHEWNYIWQRLFDLDRKDITLIVPGRAWLTGREEQPEWNYIWQRLSELNPEDVSLLEIGRAWLGGREDKPDWNYVYQRLLELQPTDDELRETGRVWLREREHKREWSHVWQRLFDLDPKDMALRAPGRAWLRERDDQRGWNFVWQRLIKVEPKDIELWQIGRAWLDGREDNPAWNYVWRSLIKVYPEDPKLREIGRAWLSGREDLAAWSHVWEKLFDLDPNDQELWAIGSSWLKTRSRQPDSPFILRRLRFAGQRP
ncbi:MAG TPA: hypothetical protein VGF48_24865 [Thermoanaerobaculia bacterium]|jgi:hypothetical protein